MKKMLKIFAAFAMFATAISFASCDMATEEELLNKKTTGGGGESGSILWSSFDGAAMQVWQETPTSPLTADLAETEEGLEITIGDQGWWGMCFCNDAAVAWDADPVTFDMSKVKTITFEAKASKNGSMWVSQSDEKSKVTNQTKVTLSTEFETKTFNLSNPGTKDYGVLDLGGGDLDTTIESDVVITVKNIKFLDAEGTETVPSRNE